MSRVRSLCWRLPTPRRRSTRSRTRSRPPGPTITDRARRSCAIGWTCRRRGCDRRRWRWRRRRRPHPASVSGPCQGIPAGWWLGTGGATPLTVSSSASDASGIARYRLIISVDGGVWRDITLGSAPQTTITFNDLQPGSSYQFGVAARTERAIGATVVRPEDTVGLYQESAASYTSGWQTAGGDRTSAVTVLDLVTGAYVTFDFTGREVGGLRRRARSTVYAHVWLDNQDLGYVTSTRPRPVAPEGPAERLDSYGAPA